MPKSIEIKNSKIVFTNNEDSSLNLFGLKLGLNTLSLPIGDTASRPDNPEAGMIRFNSQTNVLEGYTGTEWKTIV